MIALGTGDLAAAERYETLLRQHATRTGFEAGLIWSQCFKGIRLIRLGNSAVGLELLREGVNNLRDDRLPLSYMTLLAELSAALAQTGALAEASVTLNAAMERCDRNGEFWILPELLRLKGELLLLESAAEQEAEAYFQRSLEMARSHGALTFELRASVSVTRLWHRSGRAAAGLHLLRNVCSQFTEGHSTSDFLEASELARHLEKYNVSSEPR